MPTYGRPVELLNEAVHCFLDQDYPGEKELVIYNDYAGAEIVFDHPLVRIINSKAREPNLGAKYNRTVGFARYDHIAIWDDDDIYLPHRLSYSMARLKNGAYRSRRNAFLSGNRDFLEPMTSVFPATICIHKELFLRLEGFEEIERSCDVRITQRINATTGILDLVPLEDIFYIYRWNPVFQFHHSAVVRATSSDAQVHGEIDANLSKAVFGRLQIKPAYYRNYAELPITVKVTGTYHDIGLFAADIANLSRIVTLNNLTLTPVANREGVLTMDCITKTFRYLDQEEIALQQKAQGAKK